ncbi:DHA2 family efflux MFS transporter permease subunit [Iamia majanohamensis]|uniref:DHA2 family efflux MFS transporter permease subunit n=1 Tax=Iamia majanohamensis TaxID=467976 RepID=A0AAE9Y4S4_9ACTN|nr:DHA2 family efflux MFS transporter permease subunit [Iamia majanohamensis]WCO65146.1 DHA2 family efflux MFS transporter permease subunit [Iamia majanohamensis]
MTDRDQAREGTTGAVGDGSIAGIPYRWVAMGVVLFGTFMVVLDTTVVNLGLPALQEDFGTVEGIEWVVTAYLASVGVAQMLSGWSADRFGRKAMFMFSLALFTVASVLCALAPGLGVLIVARVLQGIGGGLMMPVAMAMIYELFEPHERGKALGYFGIAVMAAPAIGPVLGGSLVSSLSWRWLFLINVPIGVVGFPVAARLLRDTGFREARPLDRVGLGLSGVGLASFLVGVSKGATWGWSSPAVVGLVGLGVVLLALFARHAVTSTHPLVEMRILANPVFAVGMVTIALLTVAQYSRLVYIPLELGTVRGVSELRIGLVMLPSALGIALTMPIGGRMADRIGARIPVSVGALVLGGSFVALVGVTRSTSLPVIAFILFVGGLGSGLAMMAPNIVAMNAVSATKVSQASAISQTARQVAAAIGVGIIASVFASARPDGPAGSADLGPYRLVFLVAAGILVVVTIVAQWVPGRARALQLQADRKAEIEALGLDPEADEPPVMAET